MTQATLEAAGWVCERRSFYGGEGVEGYLWTAPDGAEFEELGSWDEPAPLPDAAFELDCYCRHCGGLIRQANPSGKCDHTHWPEALTDEALEANGYEWVTTTTKILVRK